MYIFVNERLLRVEFEFVERHYNGLELIGKINFYKNSNKLNQECDCGDAQNHLKGGGL